MQTYKKLNIEINEQINDIITAVQNDTKSRYLDIQLFNNGIAVDLTGHKVRVYGFKADKKNFWNDCKIEDAENGRILLELTNQILALADVVHMQIKIYNNEETEILSTQIFKVWGTKNLYNEEAVESSNEYGSVVQLFQDVFEVRMQIAQILEHIGEPGEKAEELQKKTLFDQLEWLIDFSQKNSVGSLGDRIEEIKEELKRLEEKEKLKNWLSSPSTIIKTTQLNNINDKMIVEITGSGYLAICLFNNLIHGTAGTQSYKVEIDDEIVFDTKVNFRNSWETGDGMSGKVSQIGIFNSSFYTYIENEDKLGMSIPILNCGKPFIIGSNLDRLKPLSSTKNTVSNTDGLIKASVQYHAYYVPVGIKIENLLRFEKKLKISTYDTQGMSYTNQGAINCLCAYQLDE